MICYNDLNNLERSISICRIYNILLNHKEEEKSRDYQENGEIFRRDKGCGFILARR